MILDALIFDVDGTMADTEEAHRRAFTGATLLLRDLGEPDCPLDVAAAAVVGAPWLELAELKARHARVPTPAQACTRSTSDV